VPARREPQLAVYQALTRKSGLRPLRWSANSDLSSIDCTLCTDARSRHAVSRNWSLGGEQHCALRSRRHRQWLSRFRSRRRSRSSPALQCARSACPGTEVPAAAAVDLGPRPGLPSKRRQAAGASPVDLTITTRSPQRAGAPGGWVGAWLRRAGAEGGEWLWRAVARPNGAAAHTSRGSPGPPQAHCWEPLARTQPSWRAASRRPRSTSPPTPTAPATMQQPSVRHA
jgi:hypothetical protein